MTKTTIENRTAEIENDEFVRYPFQVPVLVRKSELEKFWKIENIFFVSESIQLVGMIGFIISAVFLGYHSMITIYFFFVCASILITEPIHSFVMKKTNNLREKVMSRFSFKEQMFIQENRDLAIELANRGEKFPV